MELCRGGLDSILQGPNVNVSHGSNRAKLPFLKRWMGWRAGGREHLLLLHDVNQSLCVVEISPSSC